MLLHRGVKPCATDTKIIKVGIKYSPTHYFPVSCSICSKSTAICGHCRCGQVESQAELSIDSGAFESCNQNEFTWLKKGCAYWYIVQSQRNGIKDPFIKKVWYSFYVLGICYIKEVLFGYMYMYTPEAVVVD